MLLLLPARLTALSPFFTRKAGDDNNDYQSSLAYAASAGAKSFTVMIPKGSANPEVDITKLGPRQWYLPRQITIHTNDTTTWKNNDTEAHTVTSGIGLELKA